MREKYGKWLESESPDEAPAMRLTQADDAQSAANATLTEGEVAEDEKMRLKCQADKEESYKWQSKLEAFTERSRLAFLASDALLALLPEWHVVVSSYSDLDIASEDAPNDDVDDGTVAKMQEALEKMLAGSALPAMLLQRQGSQNLLTPPLSPVAAAGSDHDDHDGPVSPDDIQPVFSSQHI